MRIKFFGLLGLLMALACTPQRTPPPRSGETHLVALRLSPPALVEFANEKEIAQLPLNLPCPPQALSPAPEGPFVVIEVMCAYGPVALLLDVEKAELTPLFAEPARDSRFLAWSADGQRIYLRVDSLGNPRVIAVERATLRSQTLPVPEFVYDLAVSPTGGEILYSLSAGLGYGSEIWRADKQGRNATLLHADRHNILAYARWSPDGHQIAFIKIPDTAVPFPLGELWVMSANGRSAHRLAMADGGHGYAANWSPDGKRLAFVARANPQDTQVEQVAEALLSEIAIADVESGEIQVVTQGVSGRAETPVWSPGGNLLAFAFVSNGRMSVQVAEWPKGWVTPILTESACCPGWMRK
ncbi:MAG: TolB family protein [Anaerolineae bacterium]